MFVCVKKKKKKKSVSDCGSSTTGKPNSLATFGMWGDRGVEVLDYLGCSSSIFLEFYRLKK